MYSMQLLCVITHPCMCYGLPCESLRWHVHWCCVNVACLPAHAAHQSVWIQCTWTGLFPTCVWLKPITADDSCGAAGRQWYMSVHLCSSSCRANQPQCVTLWKRMILNYWSASAEEKAVHQPPHKRGCLPFSFYHFRVKFRGTEMIKDKGDKNDWKCYKTTTMSQPCSFHHFPVFILR